MADNTRNKVVKSIKIPGDLHKKIKSESTDTGETIETVATRILDAHFAIPNSDNPEITEKGSGESVDPAQNPKVNSGGEVQISVHEADAPWVQKLLKVRHSEKPGLPTALENNMLEFEWADRAYNELRKHKSPLVSGAAPGAGRPGTPPAKLATTDRDRNVGGGDPRRETRFSQRVRELTKGEGAGETGKKDAPGKAG